MLQTEAHVGIGGKVEHDIAAGHGGSQRRLVQNIGLDQPELRMPQRLGNEFTPSRREIVAANDGKTGRKQTVDEVAADKPRCSRDKGLGVTRFIHQLQPSTWHHTGMSGRVRQS